MKKEKILIFTIFFFSLKLLSSEFKSIIKEVSIKKEASFVFVQENDTIYDYKLKQIVGLYEKEKYGEVLKRTLNLKDSIPENKIKLRFDINFLIAETYKITNKRDESLSFYKKALSLLSSLNTLDSKEISSYDLEFVKTYQRIGSSFQKLDLIDATKFYIDSAKYYFKKVENYTSLNDEVLDFKASTYNNLSGIYQKDSSFQEAEKYAYKALEIHKKRNNELSQATSLNNIGNIYLNQKRYEDSKNIYFEAIELIKNQKSSKAIEIKADLYFNLAWAMRNLEDVEAYDNLEKSYEFTDRIRNKSVQRMIESVTAEYNVNQVRKEEKTKRLIQEQRFWIVGGFGLLVILSLTFYVILYYQRKRTLALRLANIDYEQKQKIDAVKSESQTRVLNATIDGKETERKEIAETLHDNVSALLSSANLHLQASRKHFKGNIPIEIYKSEQIINEASEKIRDLSHTLVSSILLKFGLTFAVKDIVDKYSNSSLQIDADVDMLRRFDQKFEIKTFNIIQEILNNVLKHSKAKNAKVNIKENNGKLLISIIDDGIGFDKTKINLKDGLGINQIDARIRMMKGDFFIDSKKGLGTKVKIDLPIQEKETSISA